MIEMLLVVLILFAIGFASQRGNDRRLRQLEDDVRQLGQLVATLRATPASVPPAELAMAGPAPEPAVAAADEKASAIDAAEAEAPAATMHGGPEAAAEIVGASAVETVPQPVQKESLESWLGARWAVWVGGLALALGGIFMIKYSIESGLISPAVRLAMASVFGVMLLGAGEFVRRRAMPLTGNAFQNAMIPGVLTAAGTVTLFGAIYAAYGVYGFIGPSLAFCLLAVVALGTLGLSLLHGQALAGLGLLGAMAVPALISSSAPSIWGLFGFLTLAWAATAAASRLRAWSVVPSLGNAGLSLWAILYMLTTGSVDLVPVVLALLVMIAGVTFLWPDAPDGAPATAVGLMDAADKAGWQQGAWELLLARQPIAIMATAGVFAAVAALVMVALPGPSSLDPAIGFAAIIAALGALGASRRNAVVPAIFAAFGAVAGTMLLAVASLYPETLGLAADASAVPLGYGGDIAISLGLGVVFAGLGIAFLKRHGPAEPEFSTLWSVVMVVVPLANGLISLLNFGNLSRDWTHGLYGVGLGILSLATAEWLTRRDDPQGRSAAVGWLTGGSFAAFSVALMALSNGVTTTVGLAGLGFAYVAATRFRPWALLPWMMAAAAVLVLGRIALDPTIVGPGNLGTTPVFNALALGYGVPALLTALAAYELRRWPGLRIRNLLQALASLMVFLTIAILVRHGMNGGTLNSTQLTLGEQSIYTLLTIGASAVLMTLDLKSPSPVFRYGSMVAGVFSMLSVLGAHLLTLNPYLTGETTGSLPFLNLLLIGYLLPGLAYAGLAVYARGRRPQTYVALVALSGAVLGFAWATLTVRRFWQGDSIADWKGFLQGETYSYSVVWLAIGVALLGLGSRFDAKSLRLASAGLVLIAVVKVFLIDMANLEGFLRALSFIGLGAVLIGIGLFYQKILTGKSAALPPAAKPEPGETQG